MYYRRMIKVLCIVFSLLVFKVACGQDYLVLSSNDTIMGELKILNFGIEPKVQIQEAGDKKKSVYSILEVKSFMQAGEIYHTVRTVDSYMFMKLLKDGYLNLYAFNSQSQAQWSGRYLSTLDGRTLEVPNLGFKKRLSLFLEDCKEVSSAINEGQLRRLHIEEIVDRYNACIEMRSQKLSSPGTGDGGANTSQWDALEKAVSEHQSFEGKADVAEMIRDIRLKLKRSEKIPNFLIDGLRSHLANEADLLKLLDKAVALLGK